MEGRREGGRRKGGCEAGGWLCGYTEKEQAIVSSSFPDDQPYVHRRESFPSQMGAGGFPRAGRGGEA